jgi:hypothetical protein
VKAVGFVSSGKSLPAIFWRHSALAITCHGETIGYYISTRRKRAEKGRTALKESVSQLQRALSAQGISEEEILADFKPLAGW